MKNQSPLLIGILHPLNLAMLALAIAAGLCAAWWLFPVGLLLWSIMIVMVARNPTLQIRYDIKSRTPLSQRYQGQYKAIERVQVRIYNLLAAADSSIRREFRPVLTAVNDLVDEAYRLGRRMSGLENYRLVAQKNSIEIEEEILEIDEKISRASDTDIRKEYEESRLTLEKRISRVRQINLELDRVDAHMTSVKDTLESTYAEILRIQTLGKESIKLERASLLELLKNQTTQLQHFQIDD